MTDYWKSKNKENKSFDRFMMCGLSIVAWPVLRFFVPSSNSICFLLGFAHTKSTRNESFIYKIYIYLKRIVRFEYLQFNMRIHVEYGDYNVLSNRSALSGISAFP